MLNIHYIQGTYWINPLKIKKIKTKQYKISQAHDVEIPSPQDTTNNSVLTFFFLFDDSNLYYTHAHTIWEWQRGFEPLSNGGEFFPCTTRPNA